MQRPGYTAIYTLSEPNSDEPRYVGQARDPLARLKSHRSAALNGDPKPVYHWLRLVIANEHEPMLAVIEWVTHAQADETERRWIARHREAGARLLNATDGGQDVWSLNPDRRAAYENEALTVEYQIRKRLHHVHRPDQPIEDEESRASWEQWKKDWREDHLEALRILRGKKGDFGPAVPKRAPKQTLPYDRDAPIENPREWLDWVATLPASA